MTHAPTPFGDNSPDARLRRAPLIILVVTVLVLVAVFMAHSRRASAASSTTAAPSGGQKLAGHQVARKTRTTTKSTSSTPTATATSTATSTTTATSSTATTSATSTTTASTTTASSSPTATTSAPGTSCDAKNPWASLEACGWAGQANTGPDLSQCPNGLVTNSGTSTRVINVSTANAVISCQRITGSLDINATNVTIKNSVISYDGGGTSGSGVIKVEDGASATISNVEVNGLNHTHSCVWHQGVSMSVDRMNCYGINDGVFSWADTGYSMTTGDNFTISNSYFHDFTVNAANGHIDGYQTEGANNGVIKHNTWLMTTEANSAIAIWDGIRSSSNIQIDSNLITGGGFSVYAEDYSPSETSPSGGNSVTNITVTNNRFSQHPSGCVGKYGTWFYRATWVGNGGPTDGWHRTGNVVIESGENIDNSNPHYGGVLCS